MSEEDEKKSKPIEEEEAKKISPEEDGDVVVITEEQEGEKEPAEDGKPAPKPAPESRKISEELEKKKKKPSKEYLPNFPYDFKTVLSVLLAVSAIIFLWCIIFHPAMRIERIEIEGNYEFSDEQIMDALNIHVGDHILTPTLTRSIELERSTPYIDDIDVSISFPSVLKINVTERHKLAYIRVPDGYVVIDDEGVVLEFCTFDAEDVHPVLCGLDLDGVVIGQRTDITESLKFQKMILVLGAVLDADRGSIRNDGYHFYDSVREVRIVSSGLIFLTVELPDGTVLQVKLAGVENIDENMQWLLYAIRADAFEGLPAGSLDMTEDEKIYRAYSTYY